MTLCPCQILEIQIFANLLIRKFLTVIRID